MIELLLPCGFDALKYSLVKATISIYTLADYSVAKKCQQAFWRHCWGSQLILSIYKVNRIHLVNTISLYRIIFCSILFVVLTEMCRPDLIIRQSTTPSDYWSTFEEPVPLGMISNF
jgi:hypothetical protein